MLQTQTAFELPTLSARSVALSVLLGVPQGRLGVRDILATGEMCGITPATMHGHTAILGSVSDN